MLDNRPNDKGAVSVPLILNVIGGAFLVWVIVKMSIIGYYDSELVPLIVVPGLIGLAFVGVAKVMDRD